MSFLPGLDVLAFGRVLKTHRVTQPFMASVPVWARLLGQLSPAAPPLPPSFQSYAAGVKHISWLERCVTVVQAALEALPEPIDTLVVPTSRTLQRPPDGCAAAVAHALVGPQLVGAIEVLNPRRRWLPVGHAVATAGGDAPFGHLVLAVGPSLGDNDKLGCLEVTYANVWSVAMDILRQDPTAARVGVVPIGTGVARCPLPAAALCALTQLSVASFEFSKAHGIRFSSVTFICRDDPVYDAFVQAKALLLGYDT
ncbi:hypothetical protein ACHHYP_04225 [Achlya hypogyna]|uniref:Macro domain-containing protein n=1 Tax=Achlya hypogyna TaxID=1202772 RepID=A0A1V9Z1T9_ACHHY|nr:hypothetical protein ACHHYP_04225 [Achlya hypogyna]